ncbi:phosphate transport system permease protein [Agaricicola taiwanensis]|uniref:Phosphate transport system permease protein n=1 Tax=Agaricicola taiwanensis TaxID=591372 RepID=A0A8J2YAT6_9RHOB|nr:phosphate ABC transporter permease subunit PstC [Agaricicola taiwanensis]GGE30336.1 phosphate transport system permease protein [Agaricicola taiwanensis]
MIGFYALAVVICAFAAFSVGRAHAGQMMAAGNRLHSLPSYHGLLAATVVIIPMIAAVALWGAVAPGLVEGQAIASLPAALQPTDAFERSGRMREILAAANGGEASEGIRAAAESYASALTFSHIALFALGMGLAVLAFWFARKRVTPDFRARNAFEKVVVWVLIACSAVAIVTTIGILFSVLFETLRFFARYSPIDFLFGTQWSPQTAIRADQVGQSGAFGFLPLFAGTMLITVIAMLVAGPVGLFAAIYMAEYASPRVRATVKPVLEILAGVPTVVFGFFAAITVAPFVRQLGESLGLNVASESALAAGFVMGVMIIPFVSSLSDDVINAVPQSLRDGSYAMGATRSETVKKVVLPAALPGIVSAFMLAISRAIGETMIVVMAAGLTANLTFNPLEAVTTITVQIKTLLTGDQEFDSTKTLSAFALGFVLFFFTLMLNVIALKIVRKYREQYD